MLLEQLLRTRRAQTLNDFALGMGLFLLTVAFTFSFLGSITQPYESYGENADGMQAERVSAQLTGHLLAAGANATQQTTLSRQCTVQFFANQSHSQCPYTPERFDVTFRLGNGNSVYISITDMNRNVVSIDGVELARGEQPFKQSSSEVNERVISIARQTYLLRVMVK